MKFEIRATGPSHGERAIAKGSEYKLFEILNYKA